MVATATSVPFLFSRAYFRLSTYFLPLYPIFLLLSVSFDPYAPTMFFVIDPLPLEIVPNIIVFPSYSFFFAIHKVALVCFLGFRFEFNSKSLLGIKLEITSIDNCLKFGISDLSKSIEVIPLEDAWMNLWHFFDVLSCPSMKHSIFPFSVFIISIIEGHYSIPIMFVTFKLPPIVSIFIFFLRG